MPAQELMNRREMVRADSPFVDMGAGGAVAVFGWLCSTTIGLTDGATKALFMDGEAE